MRNNFNNNLRFSLFKTNQSTTSNNRTRGLSSKWKDRKAMDILYKKVEEVSFPLGENDRNRYIGQSNSISKSVFKDDVSTD